MQKTRSNTVCADNCIQQVRLQVSLEVGRIYFSSLDLSAQTFFAKEANKL